MKPAPTVQNRYHFPRLWILLFLISGCSTDSEDPVESGELKFVSSHELGITDPSGLAMDVSNNFLWTVSDSEGGRVYKITFQGEIIDSLIYRGNDMEGIAMNPVDKTLWVIEEKLMKIIQLDTLGRVLSENDVPFENVNVNDGLEGISINPDNGHFYLLNEKLPRVFLELNSEMQIIREVPINFSSSNRLEDLSGLFYDHAKREFWIVSDESMRIVVTDFDLNPIRSYDLSSITFEGITVNTAIRRVYLINDDENRLYVYDY